MTAHAMRTLMVIPCLNEAKTLHALLEQQLAEPGDMTIVVADGGSTDGSREIVLGLLADNPRLTLLHNPARIQAAGINLAVRLHGGDARWLVRVDAHCDYPAGYARRLIEVANRQGAMSVVVPMVSRGTHCFQAAAAAAQNSKLGTGGSRHRHVGAGGFVDHGHHALMDLAAFRSAGGYREDMPTNEDAELDQRLAAAGARIWLEPTLALRYYPRRTPGALWRQYRRYGQGRARTSDLHGGRPKLRQMMPLAVPAAAVLALFGPLYTPLFLPFVMWVIVCLVGGVVVGARGTGVCAFFSGVPAMIMHFAWGFGFVWERLRRI